MPTEVPCDRCGEGVYDDSDFCPHCGVLRPTSGEAVCELHPAQKAVAVCIICHRLLCSKCRKRKQRRSFCEEHRNVQVVLDWAAVTSSNDVAYVELIRSVLESQGFTVQEQTSQAAESVWGKVLDMPRRIFVPIPEYLRATECVREWQEGPGRREILPGEEQ